MTPYQKSLLPPFIFSSISFVAGVVALVIYNS